MQDVIESCTCFGESLMMNQTFMKSVNLSTLERWRTLRRGWQESSLGHVGPGHPAPEHVHGFIPEDLFHILRHPAVWPLGGVIFFFIIPRKCTLGLSSFGSVFENHISTGCIFFSLTAKRATTSMHDFRQVLT